MFKILNFKSALASPFIDNPESKSQVQVLPNPKMENSIVKLRSRSQVRSQVYSRSGPAGPAQSS